MEQIGGHRVIRMLGSGSRAQLWLAENGDAGPIAVKCFSPHVDDASIDNEIAALSRSSSRHVVPLLDIASDADGRAALILGRADPRGLALFLEKERPIAPGEAVTLIAPIAEAVAGLHESGVVHGAIGAAKVLIDPEGAPVLIGFGGARLLGDPSRSGAVTAMELLADAGVRVDLLELASLARQTMARTGGEAARDIERWLDLGVPEGRDALAYARRLADRMFELGEPAPLGTGASLQHVVAADLGAASVEALRTGTARNGAAIHDDATHERRAPLWLQAMALPPWLTELCAGTIGSLGGVGERLKGIGRSARTSLASIRPRYRVLGAVAALVMIVCGALMLPGSDSGAGEPGSGAGGSSALVRETAIDEIPVTEESLEDVLATLLAKRAACFAELSLLCLDDVNQASSTAWQHDADLMRRAQGGVAPDTELFEAGAHIVLVDEFGDTALLTVGEDEADTSPASVLIVRTEAGWLIRSLVSD